MKLYLTSSGPVVEEHGRHFSVADETWDALVRRDDLLAAPAGACR